METVERRDECRRRRLRRRRHRRRRRSTSMPSKVVVDTRRRVSAEGTVRFFFRCHRRRRRKNVEMNSVGCEIKRENAERAKSPDQVRHLRFIFSSLLKILSFISFTECILNLSSQMRHFCVSSIR